MGSIDPDKTEYYNPDDYLYRIRKDASRKELILTDVDDYILASTIHNNVKYKGNIYCAAYGDPGKICTAFDGDCNSGKL